MKSDPGHEKSDKDSGDFTQYDSPTTAKAIRLIEVLGATDEAQTVSKLVVATGIAQSLVSRILATLQELEIARRETESRGWVLTEKLSGLTSSNRKVRSLVLRAAEPLVWLRDQSGETVQLLVEVEGRMLVLEQILGETGIQVVGKVGARVPIHSCAPGKCVLAHTDPKRRDEWFSYRPLKAYTPNTIATIEKLEHELFTIRRRGFAIDDEEGISGIRCVAAPVFNSHGKIEASITLVAPKDRITESRIPKLGEFCREAAARIAAG